MFLFKKHIINIIISLEIIIVSINVNFLATSCFFFDITGQIYTLILLTLAAVETAIGLSLLIIYYRLRGGISIDLLNLLKT